MAHQSRPTKRRGKAWNARCYRIIAKPKGKCNRELGTWDSPVRFKGRVDGRVFESTRRGLYLKKCHTTKLLPEDRFQNERSRRHRLQRTEGRYLDPVLMALLRVLEGQLLPAPPMGEQAFQGALVQEVTRFTNDKMADDRSAQDSQIADEIQHLVPYEFILIPQAVVIDNPEVINDDGIVEGASLSQTVFPQCLDVLQEPEGSSTADLIDELFARKAQLVGLVAQQRVLKIDGVGDLELFGGIDIDESVPLVDLENLSDHDKSFRHSLSSNARAVQEKDEGGRTSIHNGDLRSLNLHPGIIDAQPEEGRHQMFYGRDPGSVVSNHRTQIGVNDILGIGVNDRLTRQVFSDETNPAIRRGRFDMELHFLPRMKSDPGTTYFVS